MVQARVAHLGNICNPSLRLSEKNEEYLFFRYVPKLCSDTHLKIGGNWCIAILGHKKIPTSVGINCDQIGEKELRRNNSTMAETAIAIDVPVGRWGQYDIGRCPMCRGSRRMSILRVPIVSFKDTNFLS